MVRTLEGGKRISGGKAPRKFVGSTTASSGGGSKASGSGYKGMNPLVHRETPSWQKPITGFFNKNEDSDNIEKNSESSNNNNKNTIKSIENLGESSKINEVDNESDEEEIVKKKPKRVICSDDEDEENQVPETTESNEDG